MSGRVARGAAVALLEGEGSMLRLASVNGGEQVAPAAEANGLGTK